MKLSVRTYLDDFSHLFFPHTCEGCGTDVLEPNSLLCAKCFQNLPETGFAKEAGNPVEKKFYGRIKIEAAASAFYFTKNSMLHNLIIDLKYHGNKEIGFFLGKLLGYQLLQSKRFDDVELIVPLPLNPKKERKRGYNQAAVICDGINDVWNKPVEKNALTRTIFTQTQTQKDRVSRWETMEGVFSITDKSLLENKHILLVDDVVTTGATLENCGLVVFEIQGTKLSIATVAYTL